MKPNYYTPIGGLGIENLGQAVDDPSDVARQLQEQQRNRVRRLSGTTLIVYGSILFASASASAYHGYKRSRGSTGSAVGWGLLGLVFPIITPAVALAQGYGDPKPRRNRRTSRRRK